MTVRIAPERHPQIMVVRPGNQLRLGIESEVARRSFAWRQCHGTF
jgi:hypothetical protein